MRISEILNTSLVKTCLEAKSKYEAIEELLLLLSLNGLVEDRAAALDAIRDREGKMSTGIGQSVALPHGRVAGVRDVAMALGVSQDGIDFDSMDGKPVKVVFLVLSEEGKPEPHLMALAEISRLISNDEFVKSLMNASSPEYVMQLIASQE